MARLRRELLSASLWVGEKSVRVALDDPGDEVQKYIVAGEFYEREQLDYHRSLIPRRGRILDLGANIGNHSVYYATVCAAESIIAVEPNERSWRLFRQTLDWNDLQSIDLVAGVAAGADEGWATLDQTEAEQHNLGGTSVSYHVNQLERSVPVKTGDAILGARAVDFIKIDVEGSEFEVLAGLQATFHINTPVLAIEVMSAGRAAFAQWCETNGYRIERTFQMYRGIMNHVCLPAR